MQDDLVLLRKHFLKNCRCLLETVKLLNNEKLSFFFTPIKIFVVSFLRLATAQR